MTLSAPKISATRSADPDVPSPKNPILVSVLLRAMLGDHPLEAGPRVPQTVGEGGRRQAQDDALQVVLSGIARDRTTPTSRI